MEISFFFPAYNDEHTIEPLARALAELLPKHSERHEIIVVDDAGPDRSGDVADRMAAELPCVRVVHHGHNRGYGQVLLTGIRTARYEWIAFTDGDMQYDVAELPRFIAETRKGAQIVAGFKQARADGWQRLLTSAVYNGGLEALYGLGLRDVDCAFKLMHRSVFEGFEPSTEYREAFVLVEAFYKARRRGARIAQVPVSHRPRPHGESQCFTWRTARRLAYYAARGFVVGRLLGRWA
jgi:glycosyltransferase involved in cell wall biosynthesis